jgi:outer membrane beta-barrel protein
MEGRLLNLFLSALAMSVCIAAPALAQTEDEAPEQIIEPELERRDIERPRIDTENFEVGGYAGFMSVEDFGTNFVWGVRAAYHITESFFLEASYGRTDTDKTSFERLSGGAELLTDDERQLTYYNGVIGFNLFPGEVFLGRWRSFNTALYLVGGAGSTDFGGDDQFTAVFGFGFRMLATDFMSLRLDVRDHIFESDLLGENETYHNLESLLGLTIYF